MADCERVDGFSISPVPVTSSRGEPPVQSGEFGELPSKHTEPLLLAIAKNPGTLFLCWSVDWPAVFRGDVPSDRSAHVKVRSTAEQRILAVEPMTGSSVVEGLEPGQTYFVELGYYGRAGTWKIVATSNDVMMPLVFDSAEESVEVATIPLQLDFERIVNVFGVSNGDNIARIVAQFQQRANSSTAKTAEEHQILRALGLDPADLHKTEDRRRRLSQTRAIRQDAKKTAGSDATSPAESSWSRP